MRRPRLRRRPLLVGVLLVVLAVAGVLWLIPSDHYVFLPDEATPVEPLVVVPGEDAEDGDDEGVYMVDVLVRRASVLERLLPRVQEGATLVPAHVVNPVGVSERDRRQSSLNQMSRSQEIAVAVALEELGYEVETRPLGAEVFLVRPDAPAQGALRPGDVVVAAGGRDVDTTVDLRAAMDEHEPGTPVTLTIRRGDEELDVEVDTVPDPTDPGRALLGVLIQQAAEIDLPVDVRIDARGVGGPSAGLAFALDVVDELGPDITAGRRVAVTGEIDLEGNVGAIGGVKQKAIGARRAGADLFIVPEENAAEARRFADDLEVVAVSSFSEALSALATD